MLFAIFIAWLLTAQLFYQMLFGSYPACIDLQLHQRDIRDGRGWTLIIVGHVIGFIFAVVVLCTTVIAFPLLLDRDVGAYEAIYTSVRAVLANPVTMAIWGLIVAVLLIIGSLPVFVGLAVVLPILGHATWHLYRKLVEAAVAQRPERPEESRLSLLFRDEGRLRKQTGPIVYAHSPYYSPDFPCRPQQWPIGGRSKVNDRAAVGPEEHVARQAACSRIRSPSSPRTPAPAPAARMMA